jgi:hypothetical protein
MTQENEHPTYQPTPDNPGGPCSGCVEFFPVFGEGSLEVIGDDLYCPKCAAETRGETC